MLLPNQPLRRMLQLLAIQLCDVGFPPVFATLDAELVTAGLLTINSNCQYPASFVLPDLIAGARYGANTGCRVRARRCCPRPATIAACTSAAPPPPPARCPATGASCRQAALIVSAHCCAPESWASNPSTRNTFTPCCRIMCLLEEALPTKPKGQPAASRHWMRRRAAEMACAKSAPKTSRRAHLKELVES